MNIMVISCCKKKVSAITTLTCGTNQVFKNDSCVCDDNSIWNGVECKYVFKNISKIIASGYTNLNKSISNNCGDWRDSIVIPFIPIDLSLQSNTFTVCQLRGDSIFAWGDAMTTFYQSGTKYDSMASDLATMDLTPVDKDFAIYIRTTKSRDTMWATVCNVKIDLFYRRVDTCHVVLTKVF
jgi:hypothetical protein